MLGRFHPLARLGGADEAVLEDGVAEVYEVVGVRVEAASTIRSISTYTPESP